MLLQDLPVTPVDSIQPPGPNAVGTVLVTGASGLLGSAIQSLLAGQGTRVLSHHRAPTAGTSSPSLGFPLEQIARIEPAIRAARPDWIIHTAANTGVDDCERNVASTRHLHVTASAELARAAALHGSRLLYVSTDSVYAGDQPGPHDENEDPQPANHYAATKRAGELACLAVLPTTIVARVNFFGLNPARPPGLAGWIVNTLRAGRSLKGFTDVRFNPLLNHDLAFLLGEMVARRLPGGIYNVGAADACSKFDFARRIARLIGADAGLVLPAVLAGARLPTPRPLNTVMNTAKLVAALGHELPTIDDGLRLLLATSVPAAS